MAISAPTTAQPQQLPQTPAAAEALALRAGQVVEARVVGAGTNGTTQLAIGSQLVDAALSVRLGPDTLIQLLVQGSGPNTRLTVLPQPSQGQQGAPAQAQADTQPQPQIVKGSTSPAVAPAPVKGILTAPTQGQVQTQPGATPQSMAPNARPTLVPAPTSTALPQSQAGVAVQLVSGSNQTAVPAQIEAGTVLRFQLQGNGANERPVLVPVANPNATSSSNQTPTQNILPIPGANSLQQAVAQSVQNAVIRQDNVATLLTNLAGLGAKLSDLPKPVAQAGAELLAVRLNLSANPLDGAGLKQAIARSGVLFENILQQSSGQPLPQGDLKSALLNFRNELRLWLGGDVQTKSQTQQPPPPPMPGAQPRAGKPPVLHLPANLSSAETGARLLGQSEAALARMQLTQLSSLSDGSFRAAQGPAGAASEINIELPMLLGGEMNVGQFQIFKDDGKGSDGEQDGEWKMRFSINFSQTGEVGATVSFRGGKTGVMLWAEREETANVLQENQGDLEEALAARGLETGTIRCRHGHPPQARKPVGAYMDDCS